MTNASIKKAATQVAGLFLAAAAVLGMAQGAEAFATGGSNSGQTCTFSQQLQESVSARKQYMVKIDAVRNPIYEAGNSVEDMYGNIVPVSYQEDDEDSSGFGTLEVIFSGKKASSGPSLNLDSLSVDCMSCHDGAIASSVGVDLRDRPYDRRSRVNSFTSDHPVGMTYQSYVSANRGYKEVGSNTRMIFVNGKVGCLTCHNPLNPEKGHLVMSDRNSALCQTCHDK